MDDEGNNRPDKERNKGRITVLGGHMENAETSLQKTINFVKKYQHFFIFWVCVMAFLYWDNITYYPNSIIEKYNIRDLYCFFDYIDDYVRETEALEYAKSIGKYSEAKYYIDIGLRFLKPVPNIWKFTSLIFLPFIWMLIIFQLIISWSRMKKTKK